MHVLVVGDDDPLFGHAETRGKVGSVSGPRRSSGYRVDVVEAQPRLTEALVDCPDRRRRESFVDRIRSGEAQNVASVDETDCGIEIFAFVENIHPNGPIVFAHEQYVLNGAMPDTTYMVTIHIAGAADTTCAAPFLNLATATFATNAAGNGSANKVFTPADVGGLANSTAHAFWTVSTGAGVAYRTSCQMIQLDA